MTNCSAASLCCAALLGRWQYRTPSSMRRRCSRTVCERNRGRKTERTRWLKIGFFRKKGKRLRCHAGECRAAFGQSVEARCARLARVAHGLSGALLYQRTSGTPHEGGRRPRLAAGRTLDVPFGLIDGSDSLPGHLFEEAAPRAIDAALHRSDGAPANARCIFV